MASKKGFIVVILLLLIGGGAYWWLNGLKTGADSTATDSGSAGSSVPGEVSTGGMAENCGSNLSCGNKALAACEPAVFTAQGGPLMVKTTVLGKVAGGCNIDSSVAKAQFAGLADAFDINKDGQLNMACTVQSGLNFDALTLYLKGAGLAKCSGELKSFYDSI